MVYIRNNTKKMERTEVVGTLIGIGSDKEVAQQKEGKYQYLDLLVLKGADKPVAEQEWVRIRYYANKQGEFIDLNEKRFADLKMADKYVSVKGGIKPVVKVSYYTTEKVGTTKEGKKSIFANHKGNADDLAHFKIIEVPDKKQNIEEPTVIAEETIE